MAILHELLFFFGLVSLLILKVFVDASYVPILL